jgi:hypothetical protein
LNLPKGRSRCKIPRCLCRHGQAKLDDRPIIFTLRKTDGLIGGFIAPALYFYQPIGHKEAQFEWSKFNEIRIRRDCAGNERNLFERTETASDSENLPSLSFSKGN